MVTEIQRIGPAGQRHDPSTMGVTLSDAGVAQLYGDRFDRLREVKRRWDPENLFSGAHHIPPAAP
jgi:hypothetical protein